MIVSVAGLLALAVILLTASAVSATDRIEIFDLFKRHFVTWNPPSVAATITPGETQTIPVSFTTPRQLSNIVARMSPDLEPYVQVEPREFARVDGGTTVNLNLLISARPDALPGTIEGNIRLFRELRFHFRTWDGVRVWAFAWPVFFARTLPVAINILDGQRISNEAGGYSIVVPLDWQVDTDPTKPDLSMLLPPGRSPNPETGYVADIVINSLQNPQNLSIAEFYERKRFNFLKLSSAHTFFQMNGLEAARFESVPGFVSSTIVVVNMGQQMVEIIDISERHQTDGIFDDIVASIVPISGR